VVNTELGEASYGGSLGLRWLIGVAFGLADEARPDAMPTVAKTEESIILVFSLLAERCSE